MIPIQPQFADAMMAIPHEQPSLFDDPTAEDKLRLRTHNAYYCKPRIGPASLVGAPCLFYVSSPDKMVAGIARIVDCRIGSAVDLYAEFGTIGVYQLRDIERHVAPPGGGKYAGQAMAMRFGWWVPFKRGVPLQRMQAEFGLRAPQSLQSLPFETYITMMKAGGLSW